MISTSIPWRNCKNTLEITTKIASEKTNKLGIRNAWIIKKSMRF
ncbi:hypothetical protein JOC48_000259 [Aquibacillus albus]|uniref:Uncharacterized protein n=1 Tax=Aquibacillus albus TaxID=1168171 RepID=A0ABS2MVS7_9BACI|nr:hypothetical protein [Aquibacillus albus]